MLWHIVHRSYHHKDLYFRVRDSALSQQKSIIQNLPPAWPELLRSIAVKAPSTTHQKKVKKKEKTVKQTFSRQRNRPRKTDTMLLFLRNYRKKWKFKMATFGKQSSTPFGRNNTNMIVELLFLAYFFFSLLFLVRMHAESFRSDAGAHSILQKRPDMLHLGYNRTNDWVLNNIFFFFSIWLLLLLLVALYPGPVDTVLLTILLEYLRNYYRGRVVVGGRDRARLSLSSSAYCVWI